MKPKAPSITSLADLLPEVDHMVNRLRRCVANASAAGHPWTVGGKVRPGPCVTSMPATAVARDALLMTVRTRFGAARVTISPNSWPALAAAATLEDQQRRNAVATLLVMSRLNLPEALVSSIELHPDAAGDALNAGVCIHATAVRFDVISVDADLLASLEAHAAALTLQLPAPAFLKRLPSRILLASRPLSVVRLRRLEVGDVIVLAHGIPIAAGLGGWLSWGERSPSVLHTRVLLSGTTMSLKSSPELADAADRPESETTGDMLVPTAGTSLANLELPVDIELGGPLLRLAEIANLKCGDVLELPISIDQAQVRISVARQTLGVGELVVVGGRLGVRIVRLDAVPDAVPVETLQGKQIAAGTEP